MRCSPKSFVRRIATFAAVTALLALVGCGGGSSDTPGSAAITVVTGSVVKGPVGGASVCAYSVNGNARGVALGKCVVTTDTGTYTLTVPVASGLLWIEATGGFYSDEISGATTAMPAGVPMRTLLVASSGAVPAMLTPLTTLAFNAAQAATGTGSAFDIAAFNTASKSLLLAFGLPSGLNLNATAPAFETAINDYGRALTVISQMIKNGLSLPDILNTNNPAILQASYQSASQNSNTPLTGVTSIVVSAATPASLNGALDSKNAQYESGSSNETNNTFLDTDPYCRVAVYVMTNPATNFSYYIEIPFRKDNRAIGLVNFGSDGSNSFLHVRTFNPTTGIAIDTVKRQITLTNLMISRTDASVTLNGTIAYPTNAVVANRAACG